MLFSIALNYIFFGIKMTYDQLEVLEKIIENGSFKAAAKELRRSQPSLSIAIKKLETEFDLVLFNRQEYRPKLTDEGRLFFVKAKQCLESYRILRTLGQELGEKKFEPYLTVVVDPIVRFPWVAAILKQCLGQTSPTELSIRSEILCDGADLLRSGGADFAIASQLSEQEDLEAIVIEKVWMLPVMKESLWQEQDLESENYLFHIPQIVVKSSQRPSKQGANNSRGLLNAGRKCYVDEHALKRKLITEGFGWGYLAEHEAAEEIAKKSLVAISSPFTQAFVLDIYVMRSKFKAMGPIARTIWQAIPKVLSPQP